MWWYNLGIHLYSCGIRVAAPFVHKANLLVKGRTGLLERIRETLPTGEKIVWIHAASLGEFEQGRPVIEAIRESYPQYKVLLTFFSPSGYEIRKDYNGADWVFYLPADTKRNVRKFLDAVNPVAAIFIKYEFWLNYLDGLRTRHIPTYIISTIFRADSIFFRPYGGVFRKALRSFNHLFVQDAESKELLAGIGITAVSVAGDTRFDRVGKIADGAKRLPILEEFAGESKLLIAGSTWQPDEEILLRLANENPEMKFVFAPHEMDEKRIGEMMKSAKGGAVRYTKYDQEPHANEQQLLIIDTIGILSSVYSYGSYAYIGGGFGVGIHNTLEAAAFGIPLSFGPNYAKFREARELLALGAARSVTSFEELSAWLTELKQSPESYKTAATQAGVYVRSHRGATDMIVREILPSK